jgi:uncharacterized membrane protein YgdD (TMEM256/DUF423 family)
MNAEQAIAATGALFGAVGLMLLALAAHGSSDHQATIGLAGQIALVHAPALMAIAAALRTGLLMPAMSRIAALAIALGVVLFTADMTARTMLGERLFAMAAPIGGTAAIAGWLTIAGAAVLAGGRGGQP